MRRLGSIVLAGVLMVSCSSQPPTSTAASSTSSTSSLNTTTSTAARAGSRVYFFFDGYPVEPGPYLVPVTRDDVSSIESALEELLAGETTEEADKGLSSTIPDGTRLLGVEVVNRIARVDLSAEFDTGGGSLSVLGRVAQVVYTATVFDGVDSVEFLIEGEPVDVLTGEGLVVDEPQTRSGYEDLLPAIFLEEPSWGSTIDSQVAVSGSAITDTGVVSYTIVDADGQIVGSGDIEVPETGSRIDFSVLVGLATMPTSGAGSIIVYEMAVDGTQTHVLQYPLVIDD